MTTETKTSERLALDLVDALRTERLAKQEAERAKDTYEKADRVAHEAGEVAQRVRWALDAAIEEGR